MNPTTRRHVVTLRRVLIANALFSSVSALVFLAAPGPLSAFVGAPAAEVVLTGAGLAFFVGMILVAVTRLESLARWVLGLTLSIAALDVLWVVGTPLSIAKYTPAGRTLFGAIGLVVAVFAILQIRSLVAVLRQRSDARYAEQIR